MSKGHTRSSVAEVHDKVVDAYYYQSRSVADIAKLTGRHPTTVGKILKTALRANPGLAEVNRKPRKDPRKIEERRAISGAHAYLGIAVASYRESNDLTMTEMGELVSLSRFRVGQLESGSYDLTLSEFLAICHLVDLQPARILERKKDDNTRALSR